MSGMGAPGELNWHKSSFSGGAENCVEVAMTADGSWWLQDSKDRTRRPYHFTAAEWEAFIAGVKSGQFD